MSVKRTLRYHWLKFLRLQDDPRKLAWGMALGVFVGVTPTIPFHFITVLALAPFFRVSVITAVVGTQLCNPLTIPLLYLTAFKVGHFLLHRGAPLRLPETYTLANSLDLIWRGGLALQLGGVIIAIPAAILSYFLTRWIITRYRRLKTHKVAHVLNLPKILLQRLDLRPKKTLGQNFLVHAHQARRIVAALELTAADTVVEIGAGLGALTVFLAQAARRVVAVERDPALAQFLQEELFAEVATVEVHCQDVLRFDFPGLSREVGRPLAVAGNLPYQITSPLLFKLMAERQALSRAVLMMQQEVGARLLARPGTKDYGILSVLLRYHFSIQRLFSLGPANFFPPPHVDSVVLKLTPAIPSPHSLDPDFLARVVKAAFGQRRKTLNNTLTARAADFGLSPEQLRAILSELAIDPGRRGETLDLAEFVALSNKMADLRMA